MSFYKNCFIVLRYFLKMNQNNNINSTNTKKLVNSVNWITKFYKINYRLFDIMAKTNGCLNNFQYFPKSTKVIITLPLVTTQSDSSAKLKFLVHALRVIRLFTFQWSSILKKLVLQQQKKKNSCYILRTTSSGKYADWLLTDYILTIIPYTRISYGFDWAILISDSEGNIIFNITDLIFFSSLIKEKITNWDRQITILFNCFWQKKINSCTQTFFFNLPFVKTLFSRIFWSSLSLTCERGHGGWTIFSKFSKAVVHSNKIFFSKNFKF